MGKARNIADLLNSSGKIDSADIDSSAQFYQFKNRIINGDMRIDQRNAGASISMVTGDGNYCLDRWRTQKNGAGTFSLQQVTTAPAGFSSSLKVTVTGTSTPSSGDYYTIGKAIEGYNIADFGFGTANANTVTLSFWIQSSVTGTYSASLFNPNTTNAYPATFTINSANTWEQKTITIAGTSAGTWNTTNGSGIYFRIDLGSGSSFNGTANAWNTSGGFKTSSSVSLVSNASATLFLTGVQLEKGSTATSFDYRPYGTELALCQRYYQRIQGDTSAQRMVGVGVVGAASDAYRVSVPMKTSMRASPTCSSSGLTVYDGSVNPSISLGTSYATKDQISADFVGGSGLTLGRAACVLTGGSNTSYFDASAEL